MTLTLSKRSRLAPFCIKFKTRCLCPFSAANMTAVDPPYIYIIN